MNNIWKVVFANLVAENSTYKAELQRLYNLTDVSVGSKSSQISEALGNLVISDAKVIKWQEMKPTEPVKEGENGEVRED